jgi:hypothetical protein
VQAILLLVICALPPRAEALTASANAFRLEDSREGNLVIGADDAEIAAGEVYNTVVLLWGNLEVRGQAEEVVILSGKVTFHPTAQLKKSLVVMGGSFESKAGAKVAPEDVIYRAPGPLWRVLQSMGNLYRDHFTTVMKVAGAVISCLLFWGIGLLVFYFSPTLQGITAGRLLREWPQNFFVGWLGALIVPVFFALLVISVLGIILIPFYILTLLVAGFISYLAAALWAGHRLLPPKPGQRINALGFLLGLVAMQLLWFSGVWWAWLPAFLLWLLAWGGLLRGGRRLFK